jgi:hypothetical protein
MGTVCSGNLRPYFIARMLALTFETGFGSTIREVFAGEMFPR